MTSPSLFPIRWSKCVRLMSTRWEAQIFKFVHFYVLLNVKMSKKVKCQLKKFYKKVEGPRLNLQHTAFGRIRVEWFESWTIRIAVSISFVRTIGFDSFEFGSLYTKLPSCSFIFQLAKVRSIGFPMLVVSCTLRFTFWPLQCSNGNWCGG